MSELTWSPSGARRPRPLRTIRLSLEALEGRDLPSGSALPPPIILPQATLHPFDSSGAQALLTPNMVRHAYGFDKLPYDGTGQTIAIVDAYDDPMIARDLRTFNAVEGLPNSPFIKIALGNPPVDPIWAGETALDVEWAHALAPRATILLVEAASSSSTDLLAAVDVARTYPGVGAISMSWGGGEFTTEGSNDSHFTTPAGHIGGFSFPGKPRPLAGGITFVAASGDNGSVEWPAASPNVLAVGGTTLRTDSAGNYLGESSWSQSGHGLSAFETAPPWQPGGKRSTPDVSYDGDPASALLVYNSQPDAHGAVGWFRVGGTSAGAPQWAALIALADQARAGAGIGSLANAQAALYALPAADFYGNSAPAGALAAAGYNPLIGLGSPHANLVVGVLLGASSTAPANTSTARPAGSSSAAPRALTAAEGAWLAPQEGGFDAVLWARLRTREARPGLSFENRLVIDEAPA